MCLLLISNQTHIAFFNWDEKYDHLPRHRLTAETPIP